MTIEYVLLMVAVFGIGLKFFSHAPAEAFKNSGPKLAIRVEKQLITGDGFKTPSKGRIEWRPER